VIRSLKDGALATGEREIHAEEAAVVQRIFRDYAAGISPKAIAKRPNAEGITPPELLHPRMADVYREKVTTLCQALEHEDSRLSNDRDSRAD
jgi:Recombinase